jgi:hypothetical protein
MRHVEDRFWEKVKVADKDDECWEWQGAIDTHGYGLFWPERRTTRTAHSMMWELVNEEKVPGGKQVHHICYNRRCVNPDHLKLLTPALNTLDQPRFKDKVTCVNGHPWIEENWYYRPDDGRKNCLICRRTRSKNLRKLS